MLVLAEFFAIAWLQVRLVTRSGQLQLGRYSAAVVIAVAVVNLHTFPLMAWHTVDGVFFVTLGAFVIEWATRHSSVRGVAVGALCLGFAAICKQSFVPAVVLGVIYLLWLLQRGKTVSRRYLVAYGVVALPGLIYLSLVLVSGSWASARIQLTAAQVPRHLGVEGGLSKRYLLALVLFVGVVTLARWAAHTAPTRLAWFGSRFRLASDALVCGVLFATTAWTIWQWRGGAGNSNMLWWLALVAAAHWSSVNRQVDLAALVVLASGWMASLSWGYPYPSVVAGGLLLVVFIRSIDALRVDFANLARPISTRSIRVSRRSFRVAALVLPVCLALGLLAGSARLRERHVYADLSSADLTGDAGSVSRDLWGIRTNPNLVIVLKQISPDCSSGWG